MVRRFLLSLPRRGRTYAAAAFSLIVLAAIGASGVMRLGGDIVDRLLDGQDALVLAGVVVFVSLIASLANTASSLATTEVATGYAIGLRQRLVAHALALPASFFTERSVGEISSRISTDVDTVADGLIEHCHQLIWGVVGAGIAWIAAWTVSPWLALAYVPVGALLTLVATRLGRSASAATAAMEQEWSEAFGTAEEAFDGRVDLRQSLGRGLVMRRWAEHATEMWRLGSATFATRARLSVSTIGILRTFQWVVVLVGALLAVRGHASPGSVWAAVLLVRMFSSRIDEVLSNLPRLAEFAAAWVRVDQLLGEPAEPATTVERGTLRPAVDWNEPVAIELHDLVFSYPDDPQPVLRGITTRFEPGTFTALVGRTGSGKSTIAKVVSRSINPPTGTVRIAGVDVGAIDVAELRARVGVLTQRVEVLRATLRDNVTLFDQTITDRAVVAAFEELGLTSWVESLPRGIDTVLGDGGTALSMGEAQLVAFARLLVRSPSVIILDEATARLDPATESLVRDATARMLRGRTSIVIAHRLATIADADRVLVLDGGRLIESGTPQELADRPASAFSAMVEAAGGLRAAGLIDEPDAASAVAPEVAALADPPREPDGDADRAGDAGPAGGRTGGRTEAARPTFPLVRTALSLLTHHRRWGIPGLIGWYTFFLSGAAATWTWVHLLDELRPGGSITGPMIALGVSVLMATGGLTLGHLCFSRWWLLTELTATSNIIAAQLHPNDESTGRQRVAAGDAVSRLSDIDALIVYCDRFVDLFGTSMFVVAVLAVTGTWSTAAWLVLPVAIPVALAWLMRPMITRTAVEHARVKGTWTARVAEVCAAATTIKGFAAEAGVTRHVGELTERRQRLAQRQRIQATILRGSVWLVASVGQQLVLFVAAWTQRHHGISPAGVASAVAVSDAVNQMPLAGHVTTALVHEAPAVRAKLQRLERLVPDRDDFDLAVPPADMVLPPAPPRRRPTSRPDRVALHLMQVDQLSVAFPDGTVALDGVDLEIRRGELVVITGPVGSGKSTLLRVLAGLLPPGGGTLRWNGHTIDDPSVFLRPPNCAYVAQTPRLVSGTVAENVSLDHDLDIADALEMMQLGDEVSSWGGSAAVVGQRGMRLSGGQAQRLATARAVATSSELLVLDDLSSALDPITEHEVWSALRAAGHTIVAASHQPAALAAADAVITLDAGRVADVRRQPTVSAGLAR